MAIITTIGGLGETVVHSADDRAALTCSLGSMPKATNRDPYLILAVGSPGKLAVVPRYPGKLGQLSAIALKHDKIGFFA